MSRPTLEELREEFSRVMHNGEPRIRGSDSYPIDDYILLLRHLGYPAEYENIHSDFGFIAQVRIDGDRHAIWEGGILGVDHTVLAVQTPLSSFESTDTDLTTSNEYSSSL